MPGIRSLGFILRIPFSISNEVGTLGSCKQNRFFRVFPLSPTGRWPVDDDLLHCHACLAGRQVPAAARRTCRHPRKIGQPARVRINRKLSRVLKVGSPVLTSSRSGPPGPPEAIVGVKFLRP